MTHLPLENRQVFGVPGRKYIPELPCAHPFCSAMHPLERHHLWPRSFLRHQPTDWVKLPDERIVQNCVYLCREHHQQVTENRARITYAGVFNWHDPGWPAYEALNPQPRFLDSDDPGVPREHSDAAESLTEPHSHTHESTVGSVPEGTVCPTCTRRVPKKRKPTTPTSAVFSTRMPVEEKEAFEEIVEATAKHLGVYEASYWKWAVLLKAMVIALQGPAEE